MHSSSRMVCRDKKPFSLLQYPEGSPYPCFASPPKAPRSFYAQPQSSQQRQRRQHGQTSSTSSLELVISPREQQVRHEPKGSIDSTTDTTTKFTSEGSSSKKSSPSTDWSSSSIYKRKTHVTAYQMKDEINIVGECCVENGRIGDWLVIEHAGEIRIVPQGEFFDNYVPAHGEHRFKLVDEVKVRVLGSQLRITNKIGYCYGNEGDYVLRSMSNEDEEWIVRKEYFDDNYERVDKRTPFFRWKFPRWTWAVLLMLAHYISGIVVLSHQETDLNKGMYLVAVILTTTGYESFATQELDASMQLFLIYFICVGIIVMAGIVQGLVEVVMYNLIKRRLRQTSTQDRRKSFLRENKWCILAVINGILFVFGGAILFTFSDIRFCSDEDCMEPDFLMSLYFSIVSLSTVGLGDMMPETSSSTLSVIVCLWLVFGVIAFTTGALAVSRPLGECFFPRRDDELRQLIEGSRIRKREWKALFHTSKKQHIKKHQFLKHVLVKSNLVSERFIDDILAQFDDVDKDADEVLTAKELQRFDDSPPSSRPRTDSTPSAKRQLNRWFICSPRDE